MNNIVANKCISDKFYVSKLQMQQLLSISDKRLFDRKEILLFNIVRNQIKYHIEDECYTILKECD